MIGIPLRSDPGRGPRPLGLRLGLGVSRSFLLLAAAGQVLPAALGKSISAMHARELVEVAGLVALHGPLLIRGGRSPATQPLEQYWTTSKFRCENWTRTLKTYATLNGAPSREKFD